MPFSSFGGFVRLEITSADLNGLLDELTKSGASAGNIVSLDELRVQLTVSRGDFRKLRRICAKRSDSWRILGRKGLYWAGKGLLGRPVLLAGIMMITILSLWVPRRIFFVRVEGNSTIPTGRILEEAENCGLSFGASRREVRSERIKNALLEAVPELQWAGVNTEGCVAVISVRERAPEQKEGTESAFGHIVALHDGVITQCTATRGTLLCAPGQAVTAGDILISGYTDCGLTIRAEQAEGEVYALTRRELRAEMCPQQHIRVEKGMQKKKISLLIGKKRINLWKDSGIWDSTCDRMYAEYYITLPGGFQLPLAVTVERYTCWETEENAVTEEEAHRLLLDFGASYLKDRMLAGKILSGEQRFHADKGSITMAGQYICMEMIGKMQKLQIGEKNGESN